MAFIIDYLLSLLGIKVHNSDSDDEKSKEEREKKRREMEEDPNRVKLRYDITVISTKNNNTNTWLISNAAGKPDIEVAYKILFMKLYLIL